MFKKFSGGSQSLPVVNKQFCLTLKALKKFKNGSGVGLVEVSCTNGIHQIGPLFDGHIDKIALCPDNADALTTTFVRYYRKDGKPQETRLDKLQKVNCF